MFMRRAITLSLILPLALAACKKDQPKTPEPPPVKVGTPIFKKLTEWDEFTGRFQAKERVEVRARVSGYLSDIKFTDGQRVKKGDVLFVIDQRPFRIALERAQAQAALNSKVLERTRALQSAKAVSKQELETAEQQYISAKTAVEDAKLNLEFTEVKAPISGRVSRHMIDVGNLVNGGDSGGGALLTTVVSEDPIYFYFEASEADILKYTRLDKSGARESSRTNHRPLYVKLADEKDFVHVGKMDFVDNEIDRETGTLEARAEFPNAKGELVPGTFGRARLAGSAEYNAMLVPDDVIGTNQTIKFVFVVNGENMLEPHPVVLGPLYENGLRIIRDGLKPDDKIVMAGITMLRPGMKVTPQPMDAAAPAGGKPGEQKPADSTTTKDGKDVDADDEEDDKKSAKPAEKH